MAEPRPKLVKCPMGNTGNSCKHTNLYCTLFKITDHETWVQSKDKHMVSCAVWQLHGQKNRNNNNCLTKCICWLIIFFGGLSDETWCFDQEHSNLRFQSHISRTFQKRQLGLWSQTWPMAMPSYVSYHSMLKKARKKKKNLNLFLGIFFQMISVTFQIKQHGHLVITILATN